MPLASGSISFLSKILAFEFFKNHSSVSAGFGLDIVTNLPSFSLSLSFLKPRPL